MSFATSSLAEYGRDEVAAMQCLYDYLSEAGEGVSAICDAVIGFGVFDLRVAAKCGELFAAGRARRIIFTGGIGAGTGALGQPEADAFAAELLRLYPAIDPSAIIVENKSTNTGENIRFTLGQLEREHPELLPQTGLQHVRLCASPARLRRVRLTWQKLVPEVRCDWFAPTSDLAREAQLHREQGIDYRALLTGEIDRIRDYPAKGWTLAESIPDNVLAARESLKKRSGT